MALMLHKYIILHFRGQKYENGSYEAGLHTSWRLYRRMHSLPLLAFKGCLYSLAHEPFQQWCYSDLCFYGLL